MKKSAGSYESSDCLITVEEYDGIHIEIDSVVFESFGDQIHAVIQTTLEENNVHNIKVTCLDKGALDYTIKARLLTALRRKGEIDE